MSPWWIALMWPFLPKNSQPSFIHRYSAIFDDAKYEEDSYLSTNEPFVVSVSLGL